MKKMRLSKFSVGALFVVSGAVANGESPSLCHAEEKVIFSCAVQRSEKIISLCASKGVTRDEGYVQYRFGRREKVELEFPSETKHTQQAFRYAHYSRFQVDRFEVTFEINKYVYTVFDSFEGDEKSAARLRGVSITRPTKGNRVLLCNGGAEGSLSDLELVATCDTDSPLNVAGCPVR